MLSRRICRNILQVRRRGFASQKDADLEKRRAEMMSRGLPKRRPIEGVKHVVLVSSGKGGVGKSTVATNLAVALKINEPDKNVGLLDADVFGPSVPLMMNLRDTPLLNDKNLMVPLLNYGVSCMSMGFLVEEGAPVIWRGLMVMQALEKLLRQVAWDSVEYLIVDTPPGTGDTHLSLVQNVPISGVVLVTTPQTAALQVVKRGALMYKKLAVPIVGLVENMSSVTCPSCSSRVEVFGGGTRDLAAEIGVEVLESLPLTREMSDGAPAAASHPDGAAARAYSSLARAVAGFVDNKR